jgi:hypothetical protein
MRKEVGNVISRHEWQIIQYSWIFWDPFVLSFGGGFLMPLKRSYMVIFAPHPKTLAWTMMANRSGVVRAALTMHCTISFEWRMWDVAQLILDEEHEILQSF